jgi:hypothetical protein
MMRTTLSNAIQLIPDPPMLVSESVEDFVSLKSALESEIRPKDVIEKILVGDLAGIVWEMLRVRRCKAVIIDIRRRSALSSLLSYRLQVMGNKKADLLADRFFTDPAAKKEVLQILNRYQLQESAIEAEALRDCLKDLECLDKMEALLEMRRNRTLRTLRESRDTLAQRAKESSERILEGKPSRWLEDSSTKKSAA